MTEEEFFEKLPKTGWHLDRAGKLRHDQDCPITAVAYRVCGIKYNAREYGEAGDEIGLYWVLAVAIANAADSKRSALDLRHDFTRLRARLFAHISLDEHV